MTSAPIVTAVILCNLLNWEYSPRCIAPVDYFVVEESGEAWGALTSGVTFTQRNISNDLGIRLQRFQMEDVYFYMTDKGEIRADSDIEALSIYLAK